MNKVIGKWENGKMVGMEWYQKDRGSKRIECQQGSSGSNVKGSSDVVLFLREKMGFSTRRIHLFYNSIQIKKKVKKISWDFFWAAMNLPCTLLIYFSLLQIEKAEINNMRLLQ